MTEINNLELTLAERTEEFENQQMAWEDLL